MLYGAGLITLAILAQLGISRVRSWHAWTQASEEELSKLRAGKLFEEELSIPGLTELEEDISERHSPIWLTTLALLPLPIIAIGVWLLLDGVNDIEPIWLRFVLFYLIAGGLVTSVHLSHGFMGSAGLKRTIVTCVLAWPLTILYHVMRALK